MSHVVSAVRADRGRASGSLAALAAVVALIAACRADREVATATEDDVALHEHTVREHEHVAAAVRAPAVHDAPTVALNASAAADELPPPSSGRARTDGGRFDVAWTASRRIVFNEPFELECRVAHADGAPADGIQLSVAAWMPSHRHGTVRQPRVSSAGDGVYRVTGLLLHMEGLWQLFVDVGADARFERAAFDVLLAPEDAAEAVAEFTADEVARVLTLSPVPAPPDDPTNAHDLDAKAAHLGQFLFFDTRLSGSGRTSCATCHVPERGWNDGKALASAEGQLPRRTMTLWNVAQQRWFFWDGRADSLWSQALQPLEDPREMAGSRVAIARLVRDDADLRGAYERVFGALPDVSDPARFPAVAKPVAAEPEGEPARAWNAMDPADRDAVDRVFANVGKALAAFERRIVSGPSPFDEFVEGLRQGDAERMTAFSAGARRGLRLFLGRANCHFCHSGPNFSDFEFHNNRVPHRPELPLDLGRFAGVMKLRNDPFNALGSHADAADGEARAKLEHLPVSGHVWGEFRTPTLRGAAAYGPYMHQGQFDTIERVIDFYSDEIPPPSPHGDGERVLVRLNLSPEEKADLAEFLRSLTGAGLPESLLRQPRSPSLD